MFRSLETLQPHGRALLAAWLLIALVPLLAAQAAAPAGAGKSASKAEDPARPAKRAQLERELRAITIDLSAGAAANHKGLAGSRDFALARSEFRAAAAAFDAGRKLALRLVPEDAQSRLAVAELLRQATAGRADALLNAASVSLVSANLHDALASVNLVLADDPANPGAHEMRARIEIAANQPSWLAGAPTAHTVLPRGEPHAPVAVAAGRGAPVPARPARA